MSVSSRFKECFAAEQINSAPVPMAHHRPQHEVYYNTPGSGFASFWENATLQCSVFRGVKRKSLVINIIHI